MLLLNFCNQKLTIFVFKLDFLAAKLHTVDLLVLALIRGSRVLREQGDELFFFFVGEASLCLRCDLDLDLILLHTVCSATL